LPSQIGPRAKKAYLEACFETGSLIHFQLEMSSLFEPKKQHGNGHTEEEQLI